MREPCGPGRERCRCAARRAGRGPCQVPGIAGRTEDRIKRVRAGTEFRNVGFCVDDAAFCFDLFDGNVRRVGDVMLEDRRTARRTHPGDLRQILDRDGKTTKKSALSDGHCHQPLGMGMRTLEASGRQRIDLAVDISNPLLERIKTIVRRDLTRTKSSDERGRCCADQRMALFGLIEHRHPLAHHAHSRSCTHPRY